jgi:hypothetical protein
MPAPRWSTIRYGLKLEDAGALAIVMHSLFEEQILRQRYGVAHHGDKPRGAQRTCRRTPSIG